MDLSSGVAATKNQGPRWQGGHTGSPMTSLPSSVRNNLTSTPSLRKAKSGRGAQGFASATAASSSSATNSVRNSFSGVPGPAAALVGSSALAGQRSRVVDDLFADPSIGYLWGGS